MSPQPAATRPLMPGAEPFEMLIDSPAGRAVGVLLCHGFSGTPSSMRPWADALGSAGHSVIGPLLPGHGTRWQDMNLTRWTDWYAEVDKALLRLLEHCDRVVIAGMSMGGTLALRLTEQYGPAGPSSVGDRLIGTMLVNPSLATQRKDAFLLPVARRVIGAFPGIAGDIAKPGGTEIAYSKLPLQAAYSLQQLWKVVRAGLDRITTPVLLFQSREDHVVEAVSSEMLLDGIRSNDVTHAWLEHSYHVATLDIDAPVIFQTSTEWIADRAGADRT